MTKLTIMKYDKAKGIHEHIIEMIKIITKLHTLR